MKFEWLKGARRKKRIYLDYASATPVVLEATRAMVRVWRTSGNPGAIHQEGVAAACELDVARKNIAQFLGCRAREVIFTSGATEANNLAILGFFEALEGRRVAISSLHAVCAAIEHPSVLACFEKLEKRGLRVTYISPDVTGRIRPESIKEALRSNTVFVSVGWANGEIGTIQPLAAIAKVLYAHEGRSRVVFHSDAGQAPLYLASQVHSLGTDLLVIDSGKLYGPRGAGALYVATDIELAAQIVGGGQERGLRAGSEDVVAATGFAESLAWVSRMRAAENDRLASLRSMWLQEMAHDPILSEAVINGDRGKNALPHIVNISIPDIDSEYVVLMLDNGDIAASTKSSCREGEQESHIVKAIAPREEWRAHNTIRFSMGVDTNEEDVKRVIQMLSDAVRKHREQVTFDR